LLLPTFHPAAALHAGNRGFGPNPQEGMEEDFRLLAKLLAEQHSAGAEPAPAPSAAEPAQAHPPTGPPGAGREVPAGEPPGSEQLGLF